MNMPSSTFHFLIRDGVLQILQNIGSYVAIFVKFSRALSISSLVAVNTAFPFFISNVPLAFK